MAIRLDHTIVHSRDKSAAAELFVDLFGLPALVPFGPFLDVAVANDVTLAFMDAGDMEVQTQHYGHLLEIITRPYGTELP